MSTPAHQVAPVPVSGIPWPALRAVGLAVPMMREIVDARHQFDQGFVIDATATTATFGLGASPWEATVRATVAGTPVTA